VACAFLLLTGLTYCSQARATPLVISVPERCLPIGIRGKAGGVEVYTRNVKRLTIPDVCKGNPPARLWTDGNDRAVTCGNEPNPLTLTTKVETVQFVRLGKC
jgi:hypothetical protein